MKHLKYNLFVVLLLIITLILLYIAMAYNLTWLIILMFVLGIIYKIFVFPAENEAESKNEIPKKIKNRIYNRKFITNVKIELFNYRRYSGLIALSLTGLCLNFYIDYINSKFSEVNGIQDIFLITLTFILVYATLSLLSFTYTLVLKNEERKELIETDFKNDITLQHIIEIKINEELKKLKHELKKKSYVEEVIEEKIEKKKVELEKSYHDGTTNNMLKINRKHQIQYRKAGQAFFMATLFSGLGFLFIYSYFIFSSIDLPPSSTFYIYIRNFVLSNGLISLFNFFSLLILSYSTINFLRGLILAVKALTKEIPY